MFQTLKSGKGEPLGRDGQTPGCRAPAWCLVQEGARHQREGGRRQGRGLGGERSWVGPWGGGLWRPDTPQKNWGLCWKVLASCGQLFRRLMWWRLWVDAPGCGSDRRNSSRRRHVGLKQERVWLAGEGGLVQEGDSGGLGRGPFPTARPSSKTSCVCGLEYSSRLGSWVSSVRIYSVRCGKIRIFLPEMPHAYYA